MCAAFEDRLPHKFIDLMVPGDGILIGSFNSWFSWLIMYLTNSQVSHCVLYVGEGQIAHATLDGVSIDTIDSLFKPRVRLLPFHLPMSEEARSKIKDILEKTVGTPYGMQHVFRKACLILSGRDWPFFRWRFFLDVVLFLALLDLPFFLLLGVPVLCWLIAPYLVLVGVNGIAWYKWAPRATEKPVDFILRTFLLAGYFAADWSSPLFHRYNRPPGA
jgi:hypothetical protein